VVRATGTRRMRRRPAAGASSSRNVEATVEGLVFFFCEDSALLVECKFVGVQACVCLCAFFLIGFDCHALSCPVCLFLVTKRCKSVL